MNPHAKLIRFANRAGAIVGNTPCWSNFKDIIFNLYSCHSKFKIYGPTLKNTVHQEQERDNATLLRLTYDP